MINKTKSNNNVKPNLPKRLFWDWRFDEIDWQRSSISIIARVIERGSEAEREEMIRFYGRQRVLDALTNGIKYLPDYAIDDVCMYFNLKKEELACYERKRSRPGHWI